MTKIVIAVCGLCCACDRVGESIKKNWTGDGQPGTASPPPAMQVSPVTPVAGSAAPPHSQDGVSYAFTSTLRGSQQASCASIRFDLALGFGKDMRTATAYVINEPWPCGPIDTDGSVYYLACDSSAGNPTRGSIVMAIDRLPPASHINGEATLTVTTSALGTCEQDYALSGDVR